MNGLQREGCLASLAGALFSLFFGLTGTVAASEEGLVVERFGVERGLSIDNVTALHQDRAGFLWIGTREGLILYDGEGE